MSRDGILRDSIALYRTASSFTGGRQPVVWEYERTAGADTVYSIAAAAAAKPVLFLFFFRYFPKSVFALLFSGVRSLVLFRIRG